MADNVAETPAMLDFGGDGVQEVDREAAIAWLAALPIEQCRMVVTLLRCAEEKSHQLAAAAERGRIVAWLRGGMSQGAKMPKAIADAIERGEV